MVDITDIQIYRDGGTIEFRISGSEADGFYRLQTPFGGTPQPLFKDGQRLDFGSTAEMVVLRELRAWQAATITDATAAAIAKLDKMNVRQNLSQELLDVVPICRIRTVIQRLSERCV